MGGVVAILAMRNLAGMSWPEIGKELGRSHSSVYELAEAWRSDRGIRADLARVTHWLTEHRDEMKQEASK